MNMNENNRERAAQEEVNIQFDSPINNVPNKAVVAESSQPASTTFKAWWSKICAKAAEYFNEYEELLAESRRIFCESVRDSRCRIRDEKAAARRAFFDHPIRYICSKARVLLNDVVSIAIIVIAAIMVQEWMQANPDQAAQIAEYVVFVWDNIVSAWNNTVADIGEVMQNMIDLVTFKHLFG